MTNNNQNENLLGAINLLPKDVFDLSLKIYEDYSNEYDDGVFNNNTESGERVFLIKDFILNELFPKELLTKVDDSFYDAMEKYMEENNSFNNFVLEFDSYIKNFVDVTKPNFKIYLDGKEKDELKPGIYQKLFGIPGQFQVHVTKTKEDMLFDMITLFIGDYLKKISNLRLYFIYHIATLIEKNNNSYNSENKQQYFDDLNDEIKNLLG